MGKKVPVDFKKRFILIAFLLLLLSGWKCPAYAEKTEKIETMVVTATGYEQQIVDAPATIEVITSEELENKPYRDIRDALNHVSGVSVIEDQFISIRGLEGEGTLLLIDGRRMSSTHELNQKGGDEVDYDFLPPLNAIERIEVIKGPMSSLYGSDAMGGVINIITKKGTGKWTGSVGANATVRENSDAGKSYQEHFYLSGPVTSKKVNAKIYGALNQRGEDEYVGGYPENDSKNINGEADIAITDQQKLVLNATLNKEKRIVHEGKSAEIDNRNDLNAKREYRRYSLSAYHLGDWAWGNTDIGLSYDNSKRYDTNWKPELNNLDFTSKAISHLGSHMLSVGMDITRKEISISNMFDPDTGEGKGAEITNEDEAVNAAYYAEDSWQIHDRISLTFGGRYDDHEFYEGHFSPRAYTVFTITDYWTVKGGVSTGYRAPRLQEMNPAFGTPQGNFRSVTYGNSDLDPETSTNYEVAAIYQGATWNASLTYFHSKYKNKIIDTGITPLDLDGDGSYGDTDEFGNLLSVWFNLAEATLQGIELSADWDVTETVSVWANYTYTDSEVDAGNEVIGGVDFGQGMSGGSLVYTPEHLVNIGINWQISDAVSSYIDATYRGEELTALSLKQNPELGKPGREDSFKVNIGVGFDVTKRLKLSAAVYNLFDENNYDPDDDTTNQYREEGRRYWLSCAYSF